MDETIKDERLSIYEVGYLVASSVPEEKVTTEAEIVRKIITDVGASIIAEEDPHSQSLAYTIRVKKVSGSYEKFDSAYFGWIKFEVGSGKIEAIKKSIEVLPSILRLLVISTVRENTYLGKKTELLAVKTEQKIEENKEITPVNIEEMDKSIEAMVKEV